MTTQCLGKLRNWEAKESHKNDKLDITTFKLIGQKLHASGPEPTKSKQINSNKDTNYCYMQLLGCFTPSQCLCLQFCISILKNKLCLYVCKFLEFILQLQFHEQNLVFHFNRERVESILSRQLFFIS